MKTLSVWLPILFAAAGCLEIEKLSRCRGVKQAMYRHLGFCCGLLCFQAGWAAAQCSSAPASLSAVCNQIQGDLDSFNTSVTAGWNGVKTPVAFGVEVTTADCNRGTATLLAPATIAQVLSQLNGFALLGVQSVTTCIGFPTLYQPFYQYNNDPQDYAKVLAFYQNFVSEAHKRGLKVVIEASVLFPSVATDLPLTAYYAEPFAGANNCRAGTERADHRAAGATGLAEPVFRARYAIRLAGAFRRIHGAGVCY